MRDDDDAPVGLRIDNGVPNGEGFAYVLAFADLRNADSPMRDEATVERLPWYAIVYGLPNYNRIWFKSYGPLEDAVEEANREGLLPDQHCESIITKPQYDQWHSNVFYGLTKRLPQILWDFRFSTATINGTWADVESDLNRTSIYTAISDKVC